MGTHKNTEASIAGAGAFIAFMISIVGCAPDLTRGERIETAKPSDTPLPTKALTEVPFVVESEEAKISQELVPRAEILANSIRNIYNLFDNPDFNDDAWYDEVSDNMAVLIATVREMEDEPVPANCYDCKEVHDEFVVMAWQANQSNIHWLNFVEDPSDKTSLESMLSHFSEFQAAGKRAIAVINRSIEEE